MKKFYLILLTFLIFNDTKAQYQFTTLINQSYKELTNPDYIIYDTTIYWGNVTTKPSMLFKTFGKTYNLNEGIFIPLKQGYLYFTNNTHSTTAYASKGVFDARPGQNQQSTFSFKTEIFGGKKIFTAQWKNIGFKSGDSSHYINFQAKLIEDQERIEFHFGPSSVKNGLYEDGANGPTIGILEMDEQFSTIYNQLWLSGNTQSPSLVTTGSVVNLNGTPANGTVYKFAYATSNIKSKHKSEKIITTVSTNKININWVDKSTDVYTLEFKDMKGSLVFKKLITSSETEIEHHLNSGLYNLTILNNTNYYNQKVFVP